MALEEFTGWYLCSRDLWVASLVQDESSSETSLESFCNPNFLFLCSGNNKIALMALMNEDVALRFIAALFFGFFYRFNRTKVSMVRNRKESCVDEKKKQNKRNYSFTLQSFLLIWISLFCTWPFHGKMRYSSFRKVISHQFSVMMMMMEKKKEFKNLMINYQVEIIKKWNFSFSPALLFLFFLLFSCNEMEMAVIIYESNHDNCASGFHQETFSEHCSEEIKKSLRNAQEDN